MASFVVCLWQRAGLCENARWRRDSRLFGALVCARQSSRRVDVWVCVSVLPMLLFPACDRCCCAEVSELFNPASAAHWRNHTWPAGEPASSSSNDAALQACLRDKAPKWSIGGSTNKKPASNKKHRYPSHLPPPPVPVIRPQCNVQWSSMVPTRPKLSHYHR